MSTITVSGADTHVGRLVVQEIEDRGHKAIRRDLAGTGGGLEGDVVIDLAPGTSVLAAAVAAGIPVIDASQDQAHLRRVFDELDGPARQAGVAVVPGCGVRHLVGDLLGAIAAAAVGAPRAAHVAYAFPDGLVRSATPEVRAGLAASLGTTGLARQDGRDVEELPGEARRLAWFPRPFGPHHAAGIAGGEAVTLPRHLTDLETVRTYLALSTAAAEGLQFVANAARWEPARRLLTSWLLRGDGPSRERAAGARWACVAEVEGSDGLARAWAYGHDVPRLTAAALVEVADIVAGGGGAPAGASSPAQIMDPGAALDRLGRRSDLRWNLKRP